MLRRTKQLSRSIGGVQSNVRALTTDGGLAMLGEAVEGAYAIGDCATITQQKKRCAGATHATLLYRVLLCQRQQTLPLQ